MSSSSLLSSDSNIKKPSKEPPKPISQKIHVPIMSITSNQFPPFSYFYICVSRATNLHNCSLQSLFLVFRTHRSLKPIVSPYSWCNDSEAIFNCAYSLDFTNVPHFSLGDFTPIIELYIRYPKQSQLVGVCFLPLKVIQTINVNSKPLTYLYQNNPIDLQDINSRHVVGSIFVTIALGEREHQSILDPNSPLFNNPQSIPVSENKKKKQPPPPKKARRYSSDDYSYSYSDYDYDDYDEEDWFNEALKHGWVKPGSTGNWKEKATKKGWKPPNQVCCYTVSVECDLDDRASMRSISTQTDRSIIDNEIDEIVEEYQNVKDQFKSAQNDIDTLCNITKNINKPPTEHSMQFEKPVQIYSSNSSFVSGQKKNMQVSNNVIYSNESFEKITDDNINIDNIHESIIDKINEEEEEDIEDIMQNLSRVQGKKSPTPGKNHENSLSSDSIDFDLENEEDANASELIVSGSRHSSSHSKSSSEQKSEKSSQINQNKTKNELPENSSSSSNSNISQGSKNSKKSNQSIGSILSNRSLLSSGSNKSNKSNQSNKSDQSSKSNKSNQSNKSNKSNQSDKSNKSNKSNKSDQSNKSNQSDKSNKSNKSRQSDKSNSSIQSNKSDKSNKSNQSDKSKGQQKSMIPKRQSQIHDFDDLSLNSTNSSLNGKSSESILIGSQKLLPKPQNKQEIIEEEEEDDSVQDLSSIEKNDSKIKPVNNYSISDDMFQFEEEEEEIDDDDQINNIKDSIKQQKAEEPNSNTNRKFTSPIKISNLSEQLGLNKVELSDLSSPTLRYSSTVGTQKTENIEKLNLDKTNDQENQTENMSVNTPIKLDHEPIFPTSPDSDSSNFF